MSIVGFLPSSKTTGACLRDPFSMIRTPALSRTRGACAVAMLATRLTATPIRFITLLLTLDIRCFFG
jgi:hypothetical protein